MHDQAENDEYHQTVEFPSTLGGETAILSNKSGDDFRCLYHVGTRLEDLEKAISPPKSLVPYIGNVKKQVFLL